MLPAQQRFHADDGAAGKVDLGLEVQHQRVAVERTRQRRYEIEVETRHACSSWAREFRYVGQCAAAGNSR